MRKKISISIALIAISISAFADSIYIPFKIQSWDIPSQNLKVINICDLTEQELNELKLGEHPEIAVEIPAHTILPFRFFLKGDLINLKDNRDMLGQIEIQQRFYGRVVQDELILSSNLTDWKPFLEFITGELSLELKINDGLAEIEFDAEINQCN